MLLPCKKDGFEKHADFAYALAMDLSKSSYPTYCDGIKTREMFVERSLKAFERETEDMLLFVCEGEVQGLIHYYWIPDDLYLATNVFAINRNTEQALSEFLSYIGDRFSGYDVVMGFPAENHSAVKYLSEQGFDCIEDDYNNTALLDSMADIPVDKGITRIHKENYDKFQSLHFQIEGEMYWDSERIRADLDSWTIFVKQKDGESQGAVYYMNAGDGWFEIFGIDIMHGEHNPELFKELLNAALSDAKHRGGKVMTFFCEKDYEATAQECGFVCVGNYLCFKAHVR